MGSVVKPAEVANVSRGGVSIAGVVIGSEKAAMEEV